MPIYWLSPHFLWLVIPVVIWWAWLYLSKKTKQTSSLQCLLRLLIGILLVLTLAKPAIQRKSTETKTIYAVDVSQSMGEAGLSSAWQSIQRDLSQFTPETLLNLELWIFAEDVKQLPFLLEEDQWKREAREFQIQQGNKSNYLKVFEKLKLKASTDNVTTLCLIGDGVETSGQLLSAPYWSSSPPIQIHARPIVGTKNAEAWISEFVPKVQSNHLRLGETLSLESQVQSTTSGEAILTLFENERKIESKKLNLVENRTQTIEWLVTPDHKGLHRYRVLLESSAVPIKGNSREWYQIVEGPLRVLWLDEDHVQGSSSAKPLPVGANQMEMVQSSVEQLSGALETWASFDLVILAGVPADRLGSSKLVSLKDYVERIGGGLIMLGGPNSFALGGYIGTPLEPILPLLLQGKDQEEKQNSALAILIDRSGSMSGDKLEMAKAASLASAEVLTNRDYLGVYAFDNEVHSIVPMLKLGARASLQKQIAALQSGGGTHLAPALKTAQEALLRVPAKSRHVIVLSDGQTTGEGYESLVTQMKGQGITLSTVSIGEGAHQTFLQTLANLGSGQAYTAVELSQVTGFFTQDTLRHTGRMIKEGAVNVKLIPGNVLLSNWNSWDAPPILGYVQTQFRPYVDKVLETSQGDPLLATWQVGAGRVTAFTSDANKQWGSLWQSRWPKSSAFWAEILRKTARTSNQDLGLEFQDQTLGDRKMIEVTINPEVAKIDLSRQQDLTATWHSKADNTSPFSEKSLKWRRVGANKLQMELPPLQESSGWIALQWRNQNATHFVHHHPVLEKEDGWINEALLSTLAQRTNGKVLAPDEVLHPTAFERQHFQMLTQQMLGAVLLLYLIELLHRRWSHVKNIFSPKQIDSIPT